MFRAFEHSNLEFVSNLAQASLRVVLRISNFIVLNKGFSFTINKRATIVMPSGWGGRIRTPDAGTKVLCLTA